MAREGGEAPVSARWLAGAAVALLALGVVSAGVLNNGDDSGGGLVAATGRAGSTVALATSTSTSTTVRPPVTSTPPSTVARSTTVPKAAAAVLAAIGSTTTTTPPSSSTTTTTRPPVTTTTPAPTTTAPTTSSTSTSTTSTTLASRATITIVNGHPNAFVVTVNGRTFEPPLASGEKIGPIEVTLPSTGNDNVTLEAVADPSCRVEVTGDLFQAGGTHEYRIVAGSGTSCTSIPTPALEPPV